MFEMCLFLLLVISVWLYRSTCLHKNHGHYGILVTLSTDCRVVKHSGVHSYFWPSLCFRVQDSNYRQYGLNITYMQSLGLSIQDDLGGKISILEGHCEKNVRTNII
jgi:hypothetical protein